MSWAEGYITDAIGSLAMQMCIDIRTIVNNADKKLIGAENE